MNREAFYCPLCKTFNSEYCPHSQAEILEFRDKRVLSLEEVLDIIRQIVKIDKLQDMPVVPEWESLVKKAKTFLKNNT